MKFPLTGIAIVIAVCLSSCIRKQHVDLIVSDANIYTVDDDFGKAQAFAVSNGKFVAVGTSKSIKKKYVASSEINMNGRTIIPGFINSYCNLYEYGLSKQKIDLSEATSFEEVIQEVKNFAEEKNSEFILGKGWDQNKWNNKSLPNKDDLDRIFPETPVVLDNADGYLMLVNQAALDLAGIDVNTMVTGGEIVKIQGELTGIIIGNAKLLINSIIPSVTDAKSVQALKDAEKYSLKLGFTTVGESGIDRHTIDIIDSLQTLGELKIRIYAMVNANENNLTYYLKHGIFKSDRLHVRSFKVLADGPLGARSALLKEPYSDKKNYFGGLITNGDTLASIAQRIINSNFQMNTYAIGDSANAFMLKTYANTIKSQTNRRWRIEHAQVIAEEDFDYFTEIIPSIQPAHATTLSYSPKDRLGMDRIKGAFAFKQLLEVNGRIALGTDFTDDNLFSMFTFYAAVARKDLSGLPKGGFEIENSLSREETLKGMTIWAAYANFEEKEKGSIEVGKFADFIILDKNIMETQIENVPEINVLETYVNGEKVSEF